jgi:methionyl aminopeptidase
VAQVKTKEEIEIMKISGKIASLALKKVIDKIGEGVSCIELDKVAEDEIKRNGAQSSFKTVDDYKWTICTTLNSEVVHGIPTERKLKNGDILGIDIGAFYQGYHSDLAISVPVGTVSESSRKFLEVGKSTLEKAINKAQAGATIGDISHTIQVGVESAGYSPVKSLTGHGVGTELHEDPLVPCFGKAGIGPKIRNGMVLAIEVIYAEGSGEVKLEKDDWTISTKDASLGGLFEQTIAITESGPIVLTPYM